MASQITAAERADLAHIAKKYGITDPVTLEPAWEDGYSNYAGMGHSSDRPKADAATTDAWTAGYDAGIVEDVDDGLAE